MAEEEKTVDQNCCTSGVSSVAAHHENDGRTEDLPDSSVNEKASKMKSLRDNKGVENIILVNTSSVQVKTKLKEKDQDFCSSVGNMPPETSVESSHFSVGSIMSAAAASKSNSGVETANTISLSRGNSSVNDNSIMPMKNNPECQTDPEETENKSQTEIKKETDDEADDEELLLEIDKTELEDSQDKIKDINESSGEFSSASQSSNFDVAIPDFDSSNDALRPEKTTLGEKLRTKKTVNFSQFNLDKKKEKSLWGSKLCDMTPSQEDTLLQNSERLQSDVDKPECEGKTNFITSFSSKNKVLREKELPHPMQVDVMKSKVNSTVTSGDQKCLVKEKECQIKVINDVEFCIRLEVLQNQEVARPHTPADELHETVQVLPNNSKISNENVKQHPGDKIQLSDIHLETTPNKGLCTTNVETFKAVDSVTTERDKNNSIVIEDDNEMEISSTSDDIQGEKVKSNVSVIQFLPEGLSLPTYKTQQPIINSACNNMPDETSESEIDSQSENRSQLIGESTTLVIPLVFNDLGKPSANLCKVEESSIRNLNIADSETQCSTQLLADFTTKHTSSPVMSDFHLRYASDTESSPSPENFYNENSFTVHSEDSSSSFETKYAEKIESVAAKSSGRTKILKIATVCGDIKYLKIFSNFASGNYVQKKFVSPEKEVIADEEMQCKGCEIMLKGPTEYHPCVDNFCRFCQNQMPSRETFELHTIESHLKLSQRICSFCGIQLESVQLLETHLLSHTSLRLAPSVCVSCRKSFRTSEGRIRHECPSIQLVCKKCNVTFASKERLVHHVDAQHKHTQQAKRVDEGAIDAVNAVLDAMSLVNRETDAKYECDICDIVLLTASELVGHRRWHFEECAPKSELKSDKANRDTCADTSNSLRIKENTSTTQFCKLCAIPFSGKLNYELHMVEYHSMDKVCQFCDREFRHTKDLVIHVRKYHTQIVFQPLTCINCHTQFNKSDYLKHNPCQKSTLKKGHTVMELNIKCDICKIYFQNDITREKHMIENHALNNSCPFCQDKFSNGSDLISHVIAHQNVLSTIFKCHECQFSSSSQQDLEEHPCTAKIVELEEAKICSFCKKLFDDQYQFEVHMMEYHSSSDTCQFCHEEFKTLKMLTTHLKTHTNIKYIAPKSNKQVPCALCKIYFYSHAEFNSHLVEQHSTDNCCNFCFEKFDLRRELIGHIKSELSGEETSQKKKNSDKLVDVEKTCKFCEVMFLNRDYLERHMMEEHSSNDACQFCERSLRSTKALIRHLRRHTKLPYKPHKCDKCGEKFSKAQYLFLHACTLICKTCSESFLSRQELIHHENTAHFHRCELCPREFLCKEFLARHMKTHAELVCDTCKVKFKTLLERTAHNCQVTGKQLKKVPKQNLKCPYCDKTYANVKKFISHMESHSESTDFFCKLCNSEFDDKDLYVNHMVQKHSLSDTCQFCSNKFDSQSDLVAHVKFHINCKDVTYKCASCSASFNIENDFHEHTCPTFECDFCHRIIRNYHKFKEHSVENHVPRIPCKYCDGESFASPFLLAYHYITFHNVSDILPVNCGMCRMQFHSQDMLESHACPLQEKLMGEPRIISFYSESANKLLDTRMHTPREKVVVKMEPHDDDDDFEATSTSYQDSIHLSGRTSYQEGSEYDSSTASSFSVQKLKLEPHDRLYENVICIHCNQYFANQTAISQHLLQEKYCKFCKKIFKNEHAFGSHMIYKHCNEKTCGFCDKTFDFRSALVIHCQIHTKVKCPSMVVVCKFCEITLNDQVEFEKHVLDTHCNDDNKCPFCNVVLEHHDNLKDHVKLHTKSSPRHRKKVDGLIAKDTRSTRKPISKQKPVEHLSSLQVTKPTLEKVIKIGQTKDIVSEVTRGRKSNRAATSEKSSVLETFNVAEESKSAGKACADSMMSDKVIPKVRRGIKGHQVEPSDSSPENLSVPENDKSKQSDDTKKVLTNDPASTARKHCLICKMSFSTCLVFEEHMLTKHSLQSTCQFCGANFKSRANLMQHIIIHTTLRPNPFYKCDGCESAFNHKMQLKKHKTSECKAVIRSRELGIDQRSETIGDQTTDDIHIERLATSVGVKNKKLEESQEAIEEASIKCLLCTKLFKTEEEKTKHLKVHHRVDTDSLEHLCEKTPEKSSVTSSSTINEDKFPCAHCGVLFSSHTLLRIHGKKLQVYCEFCRCTFPSAQLLQCHMLEQHSMERTCQFCGAQFINKTGLSIHLQKHTSLEPLFFKCFDCAENFETEEEKLNHPCKAWTCQMCKTSFPSEEDLELHECSTSQCEYCQKTFSSRSLLLAHMTSTHLNDKVSVTREKRKQKFHTESLPKQPRMIDREKQGETFPCSDHCSKVFSTKAALDKHRMTICFDCKDCKKLFKKRDDYEYHRREQHWFKCQLCDDKFETEALLNVHQQSHKQVKSTKRTKRVSPPLEPPLAKRTRSAATSSNVIPPASVSNLVTSPKTLSSLHPRIWPCDMCDRNLTSSYSLARHRKKHKVFQCNLCSRVFPKAANLSAHMRLHPPPPEVVSSDDDIEFLSTSTPRNFVEPGQFVLL